MSQIIDYSIENSYFIRNQKRRLLMNKTIHLNKIAVSFLMLLIAVMSFGQQNLQKNSAEKVLIKSFNLHGNDIVSLDLGEPIEIQTWSKTTVRVQMNIALENGTKTILKSLVQAGKYNLKSTLEDGVYYISGPAVRKQIEVGGKLLLEKVSFTVFVPENVLVQLPEGSELSESL